MLLIAQPKSASTSLLFTLAKMMHVKPIKGLKLKTDSIRYKEFLELQKYHTLIYKKTNKTVGMMINDKTKLYREHLVPTEHNLRMLKNYSNYIILLRSPEDSYLNYKRLLAKKGQGNIQILRDLKLFFIRYIEFYLGKGLLVIFYDDLVLNYQKTMKRITAYWNIKAKIINLQKRKYTGEGKKKLWSKK